MFRRKPFVSRLDVDEATGNEYLWVRRGRIHHSVEHYSNHRGKVISQFDRRGRLLRVDLIRPEDFTPLAFSAWMPQKLYEWPPNEYGTFTEAKRQRDTMTGADEFRRERMGEWLHPEYDEAVRALQHRADAGGG